MPTSIKEKVANIDLVEALRDPDAFPDAGSSVVVHETHISWVFLIGDHAYKVKKPITTDFLDYGTLKQRHRLCHEELRLDRRYAADLYLGVVPITLVNGSVRVEGEGDPIEYAVKMRRFPDRALLSERLDEGKLTGEEVFQLAKAVAKFHQDAAKCEREFAQGWPNFVITNANEISDQLKRSLTGDSAATVDSVQRWCNEYFNKHRPTFTQRVDNGFVRECHGDLHLENVVHWNDRLILFDGIEFNERFRWIDVMSDAGFLAMDFASRGHLDLSRSFMNAYLEQTGDHASMVLLRWFLVYRALVRSLVASMRIDQPGVSDVDRIAAIEDCRSHVNLAHRFTHKETPGLWIMHGVSGSGKTTLSELVVQQRNAIRLRSDIERKRHFGLTAVQRPTDQMREKLYCETANQATYTRLRRLTRDILQSGFSVVVDATFLKVHDRELFHELAKREDVSFAIFDCHADENTLRQRVADRMAKNTDASDADLEVLEQQLASREPLTHAERKYVANVPDLNTPSFAGW